MESALTYQQELVWNEMKQAVAEVNAANDALDAKAVRLASIAAAVGSIIGGISLFPAASATMGRWEFVCVGLFCMASLAAIACVSQLVGPYAALVIGSEDADKLCMDYIEVPADQAYYRSVCELCHVFKHGRFVNAAKSLWLARAIWCVNLQIALVASAAIARAFGA